MIDNGIHGLWGCLMILKMFGFFGEEKPCWLMSIGFLWVYVASLLQFYCR
jgi:hypothetical protein